MLSLAQGFLSYKEGSKFQYGYCEKGDSANRVTKQSNGWNMRLLHPGKITQGSQ